MGTCVEQIQYSSETCKYQEHISNVFETCLSWSVNMFMSTMSNAHNNRYHLVNLLTINSKCLCLNAHVNENVFMCAS